MNSFGNSWYFKCFSKLKTHGNEKKKKFNQFYVNYLCLVAVLRILFISFPLNFSPKIGKEVYFKFTTKSIEIKTCWIMDECRDRGGEEVKVFIL